ncbi:type III toxin-antitoxin system ToxN/AbiQ family toxin [Selenomonas sp. AE3005]|uniref:type III toxin-antitoxin system ToxN/AbiQ family toxin n=1 Tax=Selenomonas sp. AE3005 TaxID=1485543 RepID=UPI0025F6EB6A|nr:type III toxin-antitoxin system ToxN/AbiQ family toxin [Selenomonas sp. AE3005]
MDFYLVNEEYISYLQDYERKHRNGITRVPNILIYIHEDKEKIKGSLRFNFMIPIPPKYLKRLIIKDIQDAKYRLLVNKEYNFCIANKERIEKKARKIYDMVINNQNQKLYLL